jgi:hypothetical protein
VFLQFEGPWAFAPDPKDANRILAIAPKTKSHRDLYIKASNEATLAAGIYDLSLPAQSGVAAGTADPAIVQTKIPAANLQRALDAKTARYVIRLPKPDAYMVAAREPIRIAPTYPPDPSTEKNYATFVSLRYNLASLAGFSMAGTPDSGTFNPLLIQVDTPFVRFVIEPAQMDDPLDHCMTSSRETFRDLTQFLGVSLYVDFPDYAANCHQKDPQNVRPAKGKAAASFQPLYEREAAIAMESNSAPDIQMAGLGGSDLLPVPRFLTASAESSASSQRLMAAWYLFHHSAMDCHAPELILTVE